VTASISRSAGAAQFRYTVARPTPARSATRWWVMPAGPSSSRIWPTAFMDGLGSVLTVGAVVLAATAIVLLWLAPRRTQPTAPAAAHPADTTPTTTNGSDPVPTAA
jgi:hypothetical protein